jgi:hypothetical protein
MVYVRSDTFGDESNFEYANHAEIVRMLLKNYPESTHARENINGMLPLHIAGSTARSENGVVSATSSVVIEILLKTSPETKGLMDGYGDTPIDLAWREARFCCYKCGNKANGPCLCKNTLSVPRKYLHPLLREEICSQLSPSDQPEPKMALTASKLLTYSSGGAKNLKIVGYDEKCLNEERDDMEESRKGTKESSLSPGDSPDAKTKRDNKDLKRWNILCRSTNVDREAEHAKRDLRVPIDPEGESKW